MRTILKFSGFLCCMATGFCALFAILGESELLPAAVAFFAVGIVLLGLACVLDHLTQIEFLLRSSRGDGTEQIRTKFGDFELLTNVEGEAMCIACRKTAPKAGLYYNKSLDVYYHRQCLARDRSQ